MADLLDGVPALPGHGVGVLAPLDLRQANLHYGALLNRN